MFLIIFGQQHQSAAQRNISGFWIHRQYFIHGWCVFRFIDNKRKYMMSVNNANDKNVHFVFIMMVLSTRNIYFH